ncbi:uncharacterized protein C2845_PM08G27720 [Panicum miliaceum]|uniref:BED-type domain-containing protein n=1 Tax=Panicum miliaceum TaxID=4540 RepID=A0A3L6QWV2_PANMI|nr:uncharacterized protein C2845_PM08G27720 [Panicum miliaceum]
MAHNRALMATGGNGEDADVAIIAASSSASNSKGKGVPRASAAAKRQGSTSTTTNIANEVVCEDGRPVKLKGPIEYVWSHGERYKTNGFRCFYCTIAIAGGGATRFRQHLGGISGNVVSCPKVPRFVKELMVDEVTKRNIRSKKNTYIKHFIQREVMAASRNYGTYGSTRIPLDEEAQIQMAMRESLREHALQHGSPPSVGKASGSGAGSCTANHQSKIDRFYKSPGLKCTLEWMLCSLGVLEKSLGKLGQSGSMLMIFLKEKADCPYFQAAVKLSQDLGDGVHIPRGKEIHGPLLDRNFDDVEAHLAEFKEDWNEYGVTIMLHAMMKEKIGAAALDPKTIYTSKLAKSPKCKHVVTLTFKKLACSSSKASATIDQYILFRKQGKLFGGEEARRSALNGRLRIQLFEAEMQSLQDMQCHRESDSDPCSILMDCAMYDEDNPIMDWLCNSRSESVLTLDEYVDSDLELEPSSPSTFIVEELGMNEVEVAALKNRIFPKKSGNKRRLQFEEEDIADDVESDSTQGSQPYIDLGDSSSDDGGGDNGHDDDGDIERDCGEECADGGPNNDGGAENIKIAPLRLRSKRLKKVSCLYPSEKDPIGPCAGVPPPPAVTPTQADGAGWVRRPIRAPGRARILPVTQRHRVHCLCLCFCERDRRLGRLASTHPFPQVARSIGVRSGIYSAGKATPAGRPGSSYGVVQAGPPATLRTRMVKERAAETSRAVRFAADRALRARACCVQQRLDGSWIMTRPGLAVGPKQRSKDGDR